MFEQSSYALVEGGQGRWGLEQRRTLLAVLKRHGLCPAQHPTEWAVLVIREALLRSRLNDLFLERVMERRHEVAYKRRAQSRDRRTFPASAP